MNVIGAVPPPEVQEKVTLPAGRVAPSAGPVRIGVPGAVHVEPVTFSVRVAEVFGLPHEFEAVTDQTSVCAESEAVHEVPVLLHSVLPAAFLTV